MSDLLTVYQLDGDVVCLPRASCHLVSRSQILLGQTCQAKREFSYHWGGRGVETTFANDDLALGTAVHAGLESLLKSLLLGEVSSGGVVEAAEIARQSMIKACEQGLEVQSGSPFALLPETAALLAEEQANLAYALVWTFGQRQLPAVLDKFNAVEIEPEICWLLGFSSSGIETVGDLANYPEEKAIVMMSRPDAILRNRMSGQLWTASWKTAKRLDATAIERLEYDVQTWTEGLAVQAKYGEASSGAFYSYFLKGDRPFDAKIGAKRYVSPLVRPYCLDIGVDGPQYRAVGKWIDGAGKERRLGAGWGRLDIWKTLDMPEWLKLLDSGSIQPEAGRDWLAEAVVVPDSRPFNSAHAERWRRKALQQEGDWVSILRGERFAAQDETGCHAYNRKCTFYGVCWRGEMIEDQIASGGKRLRTVSNHPIEFGEESYESGDV